jgi:hypothetical protein
VFSVQATDQSAGMVTDMGLVQFAQEAAVLWEVAPPVSSQSKLLPPSSESKSKVTVALANTAPGEEVIVAEGAAVSTVTCREIYVYMYICIYIYIHILIQMACCMSF